MEMIGTLEFYLTLLIIVIFYRDITATETGETTKSVTNTVDGMWTKFGEWGECKELELKRTRTRNCTSPAPSGDPMGKDCDGDDSEEKGCEVCEVKPLPCNNGTCEVDKDNEKGYKCDCKEGFTGDKCEKAATVCEPKNPCEHDGICKVNMTDPTKADCTCVGEYTGATCKEEKTVCDTMPCNNGTCEVDKDNAKGYKCDCKMTKGFTGDECEKPSAPAAEDATAEPTNMTDKDTATNNPQNGSETTGGAPMPMIQGIATKILLFNLAACLQNWVKNHLQF